MPPIPVHTKSPINPAKASGVTPETAAPAESKDQPAYVPAQTTSSPIQPHLYDSRSLTPTRTVPLHEQSPPPPQPGAVPRLPEVTGTASSLSPAAPTTSAPAAPAAPAITAAPIFPPPPPPQLGIPPPQAAHSQRGTSTALPPPPGPSSLYHPPGAGPSGGGGAYPSPYQGVGGAGRGGSGNEDENDGILGSAVRLAKAAGQKLASAESEIWKRINGEGN
ncbi:hypothetical protein VTJ83DRAFT_1060 [Remersonia thermophila]|uniref:Uncharacterized protein n=1 Tax=Remersonia thermophila TaxID=72144 RepID=A0ABR4DMZ7_9PEZI